VGSSSNGSTVESVVTKKNVATLAMKKGTLKKSKSKGVPFDSFDEYLRLPEIKRLVHRIASTQKESPYSSLIVLSEFQGEGRSFLISLIARAYALLLKSRVLIIDTVANNRNFSSHLTTVVRNSSQNQNELYHLDDPILRGLSGVDLVVTKEISPAGGPAENQSNHEPPEEAESSYKISPIETAEFLMKQFISALSPSYDLILLDTCPMNNVTSEHFDPLMLARQIDRSLLLLSPRSRNRRIAFKITQRLQQEEIQLMGIVHNHFLQSIQPSL
jgi:Mrp family chromosome partitioning ATPase